MRAVALAALVVLAVAGVATPVGAQPATPAPPRPAVGYDHVIHDGRISVAGLPAIECSACHTLGRGGTLVGRPGHAACFRSCHQPAPRAGVAPAAEQLTLCEACHAAATLATRRPTVPYPPYRIETDYPIAISHAAHATAPCVTCHVVPGAARTPRAPRAGKAAPHARCAGCHDGRAAAAPMTACTSCHAAAYGASAQTSLARGPLAVGSAYSHGAHARRTPAAAVACEACHGGILGATGVALPAPTANACDAGGCHDGAAAFAVTERCTRCHTTPPPAESNYEVARPTTRFSHDAHADRLAIDGCVTCHGLDSRGEPTTARHDRCVTCHAADFGAAAPTTCGACHAGTEPWRGLYADRLPPPSSEMGARMNHAAHAAIACERCHTLTTATRELRPARGHVTCTGGGCHAASGGPAPALDACDACHAPGLERARTAQRAAAPWTVRRRFRHDVHRSGLGGTPLACGTCHEGVTTSTDAATLGGPAKATCEPCHDGKRAFKMTGHGCARCHGG